MDLTYDACALTLILRFGFRQILPYTQIYNQQKDNIGNAKERVCQSMLSLRSGKRARSGKIVACKLSVCSTAAVRFASIETVNYAVLE